MTNFNKMFIIFENNRILFTSFFLEAVIPGAGAFEIAAYCQLQKTALTVKGRVKLGVQVI